MAHALPIAKLAGLLVKTLSKPLSKKIKHECSKTEVGKSILQSMGQLSHNVTSRMTIWSAGYKVRNIQPLPSDKAIQIGSELVGESFVLFVSAGIVIYEYQKSKQKELEKTAKSQQTAQSERMALQQQLQSITIRIESIERSIQSIQQQQQVLVADTVVTNTSTTSTSTTKNGNDTTTGSRFLEWLYWWRK